jgi:hypothetical protein
MEATVYDGGSRDSPSLFGGFVVDTAQQAEMCSRMVLMVRLQSTR